MKTVSVIIPNYNKKAFIRATLDTLLHQTYANRKANIVDDGSDDGSSEICKEYVAKDARFSLLIRNEQTKGGSTCRNIGLHAAKGEYIVFLDSDDLLAADCLQSRISEIENTSYDFAVFPLKIFRFELNDTKIAWELKPGNHLIRFLKHDLPWHTMSCIWKKEFLVKLKGFNSSFPRLQDVELHTRALLEENVNYKIVIKKADCYYRIGDEKIISDYNRYIDNWTKGTECYLNFFETYLKTKNKSDYLVYLKATLLSMVNQLNYQFQNKHISKDSFDMFYKRLTSCTYCKDELKAKHFRLLKLYNWGYTKRWNKIKGYNYLFRKLIQVI